MINLTKNIITSIMAEKNYGVCYEPIIKLSNMDVVGYEALSRFKYQGKTVPPDKFFQAIHEDLELFFYVESVLKTFQLENRPKGKKLFINIDPDITVEENHVQYLLKLFSRHKDIVVEIIENSDDENFEEVETFMDWMDEYNVAYAYDDFAKPNSIFFDSLFHRASVIKLDINFIRTIRNNPAYIEFAKGIINYVKSSKRITIMEGIESKDDLRIALEIGVDLVQGYLFRDQFQSQWKKSNSFMFKQDNTVTKLEKNIISASSYLQEVEVDIELIHELEELEEDVLNMILAQDEVTQIALRASASLFNTYAKVLATIFEFKILSDTLRKFSKLFDNTELTELASHKRTALIVYLESIVSDLRKWRNTIFIEQSAEDIHYLDKTLFSSILQVELTFKDDKETLAEEIEFF